MMRAKKGFMILRAVLAIWLGIGGLVALVVLHPLIHSLITSFLATSPTTIQAFAVRMVEIFYVGILFVSMIITLVTGE